MGANLGTPRHQLLRALVELSRLCGPLQVAHLYRTSPVSTIPQPDFFNTVAAARSPLAPELLLRYVKDLEYRAGRRPGPRDGPRPLDIDILLYGDLEQNSSTLTLPHPAMRQRAFVLAPLADLAPHRPLPPDGLTVDSALRALPRPWPVERLTWAR